MEDNKEYDFDNIDEEIELIKVNKNGLVSARELYLGLGLDITHWSKWYKKNIENNEFFEENKDWISFSPNGENPEGGRPTVDFAITIEFAKHIAMMARTQKSHEYRNYFIKLENKLKAINPKFNLPQTYPEALRELADKYEENDKLIKVNNCLTIANTQKDQIIGELKPKADYLDNILNSKDLLDVTQIAHDYDMTAQQMNKVLQDLKIQYKQNGQWFIYAKYNGKGYTHSRTKLIQHIHHPVENILYTCWTQKGRIFLYNILKENGYLPVIEKPQN